MLHKLSFQLSLMTLALTLAAAGCTSCGQGSPTNCGNNGSTSNDAVICPAASPVVIVADPANMSGSYALNVFNESKSKNLEISEVVITGDNPGDQPELFSNLLVSDKTVKPGDVTLVQFNWAVTTLTTEDRRANLHIKSNAKNYADLNIIILLRSRIPAGTSSSSGGTASSTHASSAAGVSSSAGGSSAVEPSSSAAAASSTSVAGSSSAAAASSTEASSSAAATSEPASSAGGSSSGGSSAS